MFRVIRGFSGSEILSLYCSCMHGASAGQLMISAAVFLMKTCIFCAQRGTLNCTTQPLVLQPLGTVAVFLFLHRSKIWTYDELKDTVLCNRETSIRWLVDEGVIASRNACPFAVKTWSW